MFTALLHYPSTCSVEAKTQQPPLLSATELLPIGRRGEGGSARSSPRCSSLGSTPRNSPRKTGDANSALSPPTSKPLAHLFCFGAKPHHDCVITITRAVRDHVRPDPCKPDSWRANISVREVMGGVPCKKVGSVPSAAG